MVTKAKLWVSRLPFSVPLWILIYLWKVLFKTQCIIMQHVGLWRRYDHIVCTADRKVRFIDLRNLDVRLVLMRSLNQMLIKNKQKVGSSSLAYPHGPKFSLRRWRRTLWYNQARTFESSSLKNFDDPISAHKQRERSIIQTISSRKKKWNSVYSLKSIIKKFVLKYGYIRVYQTLDGIRTADNKLQLINENCRWDEHLGGGTYV